MSRRLRAGLVVVAAAALGARLLRLLEAADPLGTDGFYYVVQAERLLATGHLHAPDGSWVLRWLAAAVAAVGQPVLGVKLGAALLAATCVPAAAFAGARLARAAARSATSEPTSWAAVALAAWAAASPSLGLLAAEFPKSLGIVPAALLLLGAAAGGPRGAGWLLALGALTATATAHRMGAALAGLAAVGALTGLLARRAGPEATARFLAAAGLAAVVFGAASAALPNLLHPADLDRLSGQLRLEPGWPSPFPYLALRRFHPFLAVELALPWLALPLAGLAWLRTPSARPTLGALALPLVACLVPPWRGDVLDLGYRLALLAPALAAPLAAAAALALRASPAEAVAAPPGRLAVATLAAALLAWPGAWAGIDPAAHPPWDAYRRLVAAIPRPLPGLVIAHQGLAFLYDHETGRDAMSWAPEPELDRHGVGRIAWGIEPGEWREWAPIVEGAPVRALAPRYAWVREDVWEAFVFRARAEGDDGLRERLDDWRNPGRVRPRSLARNHPAPTATVP